MVGWWCIARTYRKPHVARGEPSDFDHGDFVEGDLKGLLGKLGGLNGRQQSTVVEQELCP